MKISEVQYVRILLTKKCNMACTFCHQEGCAFSEKDIDFELLLDTVKKLYEIGYRKIKLMGGEPMLYPRIKDVVQSIKRIGTDIDLSMISNGSVPVEKYLEVFESGLDRLNISVHGWNESYFCENTGNSKEQCGKVKANILSLVAQRKINKINYVLQKGKNESDFHALIESVKNFNIVVDVLNLLIFPGQEQATKLQYSFVEIEQFVKEHWTIDKSVDYDNPYSLPSKRLILTNGCIINLKVNQLNKQEIFQSCKDCLYKESCIEGIKAIRLTNDALIQPCLLRTDNTLKLSDVTEKDAIINYLKEL